MENERTFYEQTGRQLPDTAVSQMFGKPCFKINGKAFICFFQDCMVFKLTDEAHREALTLTGSVLFDPSGKGRAMKEWVQVTFEHKSKWKKLAKAAYDYVSANS
jgi:hypothetical protein